MIKAELRGASELASLLRSLPRATETRRLKEMLSQAAVPIQETAASTAPRAPEAPHLADNIIIQEERRSGEDPASVAVGPRRGLFSAYGGFVELGTSRHPAQPYLVPALLQRGQQSIRMCQQWIWLQLAKLVGTRGTSSGTGL